MSDNWLIFIPERPDFVPSTAAHVAARALVERIAPYADEVTIVVTDKPRFIDCGANLERFSCPTCGSELDFGWWREAMDIAYASGFADLSTQAPCCGSTVSLNDLVYDWPCGFARFRIEARNPGIAGIDQADNAELAAVTQTGLRQIWRHL